MTILKVTYGNPVASIKGICEHYQISDRTARMIVKELEQERGRYGDYTVLGDGALKRVNFLAFTDYWQFRKMLQDKNARKHVPVYSPQKVARSLKLFRAMSKASWDQVRRLYLVAFAGMFADQQPEPEPYRDRTLVMLMHLEDQEAWKKIYTMVKVLTDEVFE